mmetsp:Transcript_29501/g.35912  ORF Transcript_29501/g.35912 Transcript_29501/m.35912 type:complete len:144 (-) Transcript_29501:144-575(-)
MDVAMNSESLTADSTKGQSPLIRGQDDGKSSHKIDLDSVSAELRILLKHYPDMSIDWYCRSVEKKLNYKKYKLSDETDTITSLKMKIEYDLYKEEESVATESDIELMREWKVAADTATTSANTANSGGTIQSIRSYFSKRCCS